jgi:hypothetical protein
LLSGALVKLLEAKAAGKALHEGALARPRRESRLPIRCPRLSNRGKAAAPAGTQFKGAVESYTWQARLRGAMITRQAGGPWLCGSTAACCGAQGAAGARIWRLRREWREGDAGRLGSPGNCD